MKKYTMFKSIFILLIIVLLSSKSTFAADPNWTVNASSFQYNMTMTAVVNIDCAEQLSPSNRIGVFSGTECRGSALTSQVYNGKYTASLFIYSNSVNGENLSFKIYNAAKDTVYEAKVTVQFQQNAAYGNASAPYVVYSKFPCYFTKDILPVTNYLSPNNDGLNDYFEIADVDAYGDYALTIYDENGLEVYSISSNYKNDWNGSLDGKTLPTGAYYYLFRKEASDKEYKGIINIFNAN